MNAKNNIELQMKCGFCAMVKNSICYHQILHKIASIVGQLSYYATILKEQLNLNAFITTSLNDSSKEYEPEMHKKEMNKTTK